MTIKISIIVCTSLDYGIGFKGKIPWSIPEDMAYFKDVTMGKDLQNAVVMGRNTWESLPKKEEGLKGRLNIVVSKTLCQNQNLVNNSRLIFTDTLQNAINSCSSKNIHEIFIIGGARLYSEALQTCDINFVYLNKINKIYECDTYFPIHLLNLYEPISCQQQSLTDFDITMNILTLKNTEEHQYLDLVKDILENGSLKSNRTGIKTLSVFGRTMTFSLKDNKIPLITTKRTWFKGIVEELLWFLSGSIDSKILEEKGINIWSGNTSREFLDKNGFTDRSVGCIGPGYSFQWRHFGCPYVEGQTDYTDQGFDQIKHIVNLIKNDPDSRRILLNSWDPSTVDNSSLNPCHVLAQFNVTDGYLNCQMYQRSCDILLGCPFNIASYSLLTIMLAHVTGLKPGTFIHVIGDAHIYETHIEALKEQITKVPYKFPKCHINRNVTDIFDFTYTDFTISDYIYHKSSIKCDMVI